MRILYANKYHFLKGGCERVLFTEMELMRSRGHEVAVFASQHPQNQPSEFSRLFSEQENYFDVPLLHKVKAAVKIVYSFETLRKFGEVIDAFKPDLIHAHNVYAQLSTAVLDAAKKRRVPLVLTAHDYKLVCPSYMMLDHGRICEKCIDGNYLHCLLTSCHKESRIASAVYTAESYFAAFSRKYDLAERIICPSSFIQSKLAHRFPKSRLVVLNNPADLSLYQPKFENDGYYLFTGRLSKEKGVLTLIKAFRELGLPLRIAGTGPMEADCQEMAKGAANIRLVGYQTGSELEALYQGAYACVVPSEWYENAPMAVIEPLGYAKPVIAARIGGIPELMRDGETGYLFNSFDPEDLKTKIRQLQGLSMDEYSSLCQKSREWALMQFSLERHYEGLMSIYQRATEKR